MGLVGGPGLSHEIADRIARRLPSTLQHRFPGTAWRIVLRTEPLAGAAGMGVDLLQLVRRRLLEEGWQLAVCLTDQPLAAGYRPVTAQASQALSVGVISVPALGGIDVDERALDAVVRTVEALLQASDARRPNRGEGRAARLRARLDDLRQLSSPLGRALPQHEGTVRFATATARGNMRLLIGKVRGNRPWQLVIGLSNSLVAALGTSAFALTSPILWRIADTMPLRRLLGIALASLVVIGFTIIAAHGLWERAPSRAARRQVVLVNLATTVTVALGVLTPYLVLLALSFLFGHTLITVPVLQRELYHEVHLVDYARIAWLVSSLATLGGALGAVLETNAAVRDAAFCIRQTERRGHDRVGG
ncbi:MAG: hypothetical protein JWM53_1970 [bacterium]|nr:hypothetical protein [bacterium]